MTEWDGLDGMDCVGSLVGLRYRASEMEVAPPEAISGMGSSASEIITCKDMFEAFKIVECYDS